MAVARSSSGRVTKSQGVGAVFGIFFPIDNVLHSIAFGTHTKTAEPIQMPFGMMTRVGCRYHVLDVGPNLPWGRANFGGNVESKITSLPCKTDHSIANNVVQQKGSFSMPGKHI